MIDIDRYRTDPDYRAATDDAMERASVAGGFPARSGADLRDPALLADNSAMDASLAQARAGADRIVAGINTPLGGVVPNRPPAPPRRTGGPEVIVGKPRVIPSESPTADADGYVAHPGVLAPEFDADSYSGRKERAYADASADSHAPQRVRMPNLVDPRAALEAAAAKPAANTHASGNWMAALPNGPVLDRLGRPIDPKPATSAPPSGAQSPQQKPAAPSMPRPIYIPPGWDDRRHPWRQGTREDVIRGQNDQLQGLQDLGQAQEDAAATREKLIYEQADEIARANAAAKIAEDRRQAERAQRDRDLEEGLADLQRQKIDPKRLVYSLDTPTRLTGILGSAIFGFLNAQAGQQGNAMIEQFDREVDRDIDAQKANLAQKNTNYGFKRGLYGDMLTRFGDERQAELAAKMGIRENYANYLEGVAAGAAVPETKARTMMAAGQLRAANAADRGKLLDLPSFSPGGIVGFGGAGGGGGGSGSGAHSKEGGYVADLGINVDNPVLFQETIRKMAAMRQRDALVQRLIELRNHYGNFIPGTPEHAQMESLSRAIVLAEKDMNALGQLTESDLKLVSIDPDGGTSWKPGTSARLEETLRQSAQQKEIWRRSLGGVGAQRQIVPGPDGRLRVDNTLTGEIDTPKKPLRLGPPK